MCVDTSLQDFGHSIPGHGGMTDRMDCQFLMGLFSYMYYQSFIKTYNVSVGAILANIVNNLSPDDQRELLDRLQRYLVGQGRLDPGFLEKCGVAIEAAA
ncbi:hypothetical protein BC936DRAFT_142750 [Jimgerdemannia flammicorona]|uniref:phosphatidate cytidylyltransferase n=1 Tax=Jimgerdemannia flammicorona TaxID=994334 RepID=A0A432ZZV9_9FUNG|nr:hypothetical protein BC936DRAFT_142750 [Jimgerdemannia flammicorona]